VGGGLSYGNLGYSHHAVQDYALLRVMPYMLIAAPGDPMEVRACVRYLMAHPQPSYLRLGKAGEPSVHASVPQIEPGRWLELAEGDGPSTLLTTGAPLALASSWLERAEYRGWALHSLPLWGMAQKAAQAAQAESWRRIVTLEDHVVDAGFGSWLAESCLHLRDRTAIEIRGLSREIFGKVGSQRTLNALGGLL
jgi:transketolase